jgi:hypothetical protein
MRTWLIVLFTLLLVGCSSSQPADDSVQITADRAWHLAAMYYAHYISGCGGVGEVAAHGSYWQAPVHFGVAGTPQGSIRVDRYTGTVSYGWRHPTVSAKSLDQWFASYANRGVQPNSLLGHEN